MYISPTILKSIHNKDYSVVKTFKAASHEICRFFYFYAKETYPDSIVKQSKKRDSYLL